MKVLCDDITTIFVDGEHKHVAGTGKWDNMATLNIPASTVVVGIRCHNTDVTGPRGIKVKVQNSNSEDVIESDNYWKCSNRYHKGWSKSSFSENDSWERATNVRNNLWPEKLPDKKIFWTSRAQDETVYCRIKLSTPPPGRTTSFRNI